MAVFFEEPGLKRDTSQAVVETMQAQSDKFSRPGQNERKYGARNFGALHFTWQARYFGAPGAGLGRFRSLIPCACHATDSQHTVNTTVNTQSTRQSTRALFLRILSRSADLDSCSPNSSLRWGILKFPHATHVLLENSQEKCSC